MADQQTPNWNQNVESSSQSGTTSQEDRLTGNQLGTETGATSDDVNQQTGGPNPAHSNWMASEPETEGQATQPDEGTMHGHDNTPESQRRETMDSEQGSINTGEGTAERGGWSEGRPGDLGSGQSGMGNNPPIDLSETGSSISGGIEQRDDRSDPDLGGNAGGRGDFSGNSMEGGAGGSGAVQGRPGESNTMDQDERGGATGESQTAMQDRLGSADNEGGNWREVADSSSQETGEQENDRAGSDSWNTGSEEQKP